MTGPTYPKLKQSWGVRVNSLKSPFYQLQKPTSCYQQKDLFQLFAYQVTYIFPHLFLSKDAVKLQGDRVCFYDLGAICPSPLIFARVLPVHSTPSTLLPDLELGRKAYKAVISQQTAVQGQRQQLISTSANPMGGGVGGQNSKSLFVNQSLGKRKTRSK